MVDGEGDPDSANAYRDAIEALYAVAYAVKFVRNAAGRSPDFAVMPLECAWWADDLRGVAKAKVDADIAEAKVQACQ